MRLLITGASGFLGRHIVAEALRRGHTSRALVRPAASIAKLPWAMHPKLELVRLDLRARRELADALTGVDCVIHAAAAKAGDLYAQFAGTVVATENLIGAMAEAGVQRIVGISTFSVYDYQRIWTLSRLDESSPVEKDAFERDEYAITKLIQERLIREQGEHHGWKVTIVRPGVIYGRGHTWTARIGAGETGRLWLRIGGWGRLPLTYVENCAQAIVMAAESDAAIGRILNIVDDDPPTQRRYAAELRRRMPPKPRIIPVPWLAMRALAALAWGTNRLLFNGRAKLPGILIPARVHARFKPLRYSNRLIREVLGWRPRYTFEEALDRSFGTAADAEGVAVSHVPATSATQS